MDRPDLNVEVGEVENRLKVGFAGICQKDFRGDKDAEISHAVDHLGAAGKAMGFDFHPFPGRVVTGEDAARARKALDASGVDFLLIQSTSIGSGEALVELLKTDARVGLWAVPEPASEGALPLNSLCGLNMNAGIMGTRPEYRDRRFKWFYGRADSRLFTRRFELTARALSALKKIHGARIALVGGVAPGFYDFEFDAGKVRERFGVAVEEGVRLKELFGAAEAAPEAEVENIASQMRSAARDVAPEAADNVERAARVEAALRRMAERGGWSGIALRCWPEFFDQRRLSVCSTVGRLNESGIAVACEGDVISALSMMLLNHAAGDVGMLMDVSDVDLEGDAVLFWHCGPAPWSCADEEGVKLTAHSIGGREQPDGSFERFGCVGDMVLSPGAMTVMRLTQDADAALLVNGSFVRGKNRGFDGSRGWFTGFSFPPSGEGASALDFVNTVMAHRFPHHFAMVRGNASGVLLEAFEWLGVDVLPLARYADHLQT
ncbi:MAG: hypothetical protein AB1742_10845 [bacterium]